MSSCGRCANDGLTRRREGAKARRVDKDAIATDQRRLKYAATINDESLTEATEPDYELQYIDIGNVDSYGTVHDIVAYKFEEAPSRARRIVRHGDVIVSTVRTYLQAIAPIENPPENMIVSTGFAVIRPDRKLFDARFCKYAVREKHFLWEVESRSTGVSYPAINASDLADIRISLPDLEIQRLIADYLDRETARIDALVAEKEKMLALLEEKRAALISSKVTRGLDPDVPLKPSGLDWLGEIPAHWDIIQVRFACPSLQTGPFGSQLHAEEHIDNGVPVINKGETEVHEAIREALVNALIHANYQGQGGIVVEKFRDAFEFSNPGTLLASFDQLLRGNVSECRNKALQTMFMLIGAAEKAGSGVDKMRKGWASKHWRSPMIREQVQPDRVSWRLPMVSLIPEESLARLEGIFGRKFNSFSKYEVQALVTADVEGSVDNARMRQICAIHAADVTRLLQGLVASGALVQEGQGRWSRYRLPDAERSLHKARDSEHKAGDSEHKPPAPNIRQATPNIAMRCL